MALFIINSIYSFTVLCVSEREREQRGLAWGAILHGGPLLGATLAFNPVSQLKWDTNPAKEKASLTPKVSAQSPTTQ